MLKDISTKSPEGLIKDEARKATKAIAKEIRELQNLMFAQRKHSLLVVLQGMDASGKDGVTRKVFGKVNPSGCRVHSFKKPTDEEFAHDFLWRVEKHAPRKGMIQIFNRSHYEDVLIQRVHNWIDMDRVHQRFQHINAFEQRLEQENETKVLKFYLHVSPDEQLIRLNERISNPVKNWKHNPNDFKERERWDDYMLAYEDCFKYCGTEIPWIIIPSDDNFYKEYIVAKTVRDTLLSFDMSYPLLKEE